MTEFNIARMSNKEKNVFPNPLNSRHLVLIQAISDIVDVDACHFRNFGQILKTRLMDIDPAASTKILNLLELGVPDGFEIYLYHNLSIQNREKMCNLIMRELQNSIRSQICAFSVGFDFLQSEISSWAKRICHFAKNRTQRKNHQILLAKRVLQFPQCLHQ